MEVSLYKSDLPILLPLLPIRFLLTGEDKIWIVIRGIFMNGGWTRMKTVTFTIADGNHMSYRDIEVLLAKMDGVERALIDVNDGDLKIEFNEDTIETVKIKQEIERQGFHINSKE